MQTNKSIQQIEEFERVIQSPDPNATSCLSAAKEMRLTNTCPTCQAMAGKLEKLRLCVEKIRNALDVTECYEDLVLLATAAIHEFDTSVQVEWTSEVPKDEGVYPMLTSRGQTSALWVVTTFADDDPDCYVIGREDRLYPSDLKGARFGPRSIFPITTAEGGK